jgi:DnaJ-domain-containing protein 1
MLQETIHTTDCSGKLVEKSVYEAVDALPNFDIGHAKSSQTKSFSCFIPPQGGSKKTTVYVDTPGFEDTDNQEIDIATSVMLSHIAKKCKTLKFIVLINYTSLLEDRGGAARSILRFTRAFVKDFGKDKKSFMFLFTHTNEIRGISNSLDSARKALQDEVLRLIDGTSKNDTDLLSLLDFMKKSLEKGYPFVDVLHPMDTDFLRLKTMIESKISPIKEPTLATNCGLTGPSRHKLSGEINGVLLRTRKHLQANPPDVQSVLENQKTLEYLGKHIDLGDVQRAAEDGKSLIDQYIQECRTSIEEGVSKGAVCDYDFGYRNAEDLQAALTRLDQLGAANLTHYLRKMIMSTVSEIQLSILRCDDSRLSWDARNLNKLRSWCKAFHDHEFAAIYPEVLAHLQSDIQNCVNAVGEFECHTEVQEEALSIHIDNVCCLDSVLTQLDQLSDHDMDFDAMNQAKKRALGTIYVLLSSCREEASDSMKTDTLDEDAMKTLLSRLSFIETLQSVLNAKGAFADLSYDACQLSEDLQRNVSLQFEESCNDIRKGNVYGFRGPLEKMRAVFETFDCIHGPEASRVRHNYQNLVDTIFASFKSAADSLLVESQSVSTDGIVNGNEAGVALNRLSEQSWFDEFLPPERCLIQDTCQKIQLEYEGRCKKIQLEALNILGKMNCSGKRKRNQKPWSRSTGSVEALRALKCIYDEFAEIESFALVTVNESIQADCCKVRSEILYHAEKIMNAAKSCVGNWKSASTETPSKALMSRLNTFLEEIGLTESLTNDTWCQNELASTEALVLSKFRSFSDEASKVFNSKTDFVNMARCLDIISDGDKNANIRLYLPSLASAKEQARSAVIQHAQEIQKLVAGTSEWDKIDMHLKELESAMVLDSYLSGEVELLLKPLCALRDRKETYVDSEIEEMIRSEDFQAISKFLAPLAVSADQLKRQKFHRYLRDIHNSLQSRIGQSTNFLPGGLPLNTVTKKIVENVGKLEDAQKELGEYLKDELPLSREIEKLKFRLNEKLRRVLDRMETDIQEKNLVRLATGREEIMTFVQVTRRYVDSKSLSRHRQIRKQYDQTLSSVPELVDAFFASLFQDGKDLLDILSGLKQASLSGSAEKKKMTTIYNETKQLLDKRLREYLKELELMVDYNSCYEDAISTLISLKRYSDLGLQDHVGEWIVFEMKELLDSCLKKQREVNRTFNFVGPNADTNRTSLAANLDKLDPSEKSWFAFWNRGKEYKSQCKKAEESVLDLYSKGLSALQSRNFSVLEEYIQTLCQLDQQVHKHVKNIDAKVTDLETRARDLFLDVCKQLKDALLGKSGFQYRSLFADFRSFVLEVASVFDSKECKKAYSLTNQLFYEKLQKEVAQLKEELELTNNSFDFSEIKSKVENVRILGEFVADHYTLFFEEVKNCDHIQADSWLKKIAEVCHEHFSAGRDFGKMKYYVQLGVVPSSSQDKIRREYMIMAKRYHPDKVAVQGEETNARFRAIREAWEALENPNQSPVSTKARPFDAMVRSIGQRLQKITQEHLKHQKYEIVVKLLFQLSSIRELEDLVSPRLDSKHIQSSVTNLVKGHVEQVRISVKSHWYERKYRELNEDIDDLKRMEKHFKTVSTDINYALKVSIWF